jgi:phage gpG-like protein
MANLRIEASQNDIINQLRAAGLAKLDNPAELRGLFAAWAEKGTQVVDRAFETETGPGGQPWADLQPATLRYSRNRNRRGILRDSNTLFKTTIGVPTNDGAEIGSNQEVNGFSLLAIHQFGAPRAGIPARRVLPMDDQGEPLAEFIDEIEELTLDWFFG